MRLLGLIFSSLVIGFCSLPSLADRNSYFVINEPSRGMQWVNGDVNPVLWTKGLLDGVNDVDLELARLSTDGLILVALNVPTKPGSLNLMLQDVPPGDDYYLLFINSTHGLMYAISPRFTILPSGSSSSNSSTPVRDAPTVTISGGPNPTASFAATFPALANGAMRRRGVFPAEDILTSASLACSIMTCMLGAACMFL